MTATGCMSRLTPSSPSLNESEPVDGYSRSDELAVMICTFLGDDCSRTQAVHGTVEAEESVERRR